MNKNDCGMHLLMALPQSAAEPDIYNHKACMVLERSGFHFLQNIILPDKTASLYRIDGAKDY